MTVPATLDASLTAPTNVATVFTAGASGSKIEQIALMQIANTTAGGLVNIFLYDGTTYHLFDQFQFGTLTLPTTTTTPRQDKYYANLVLKTGWSVRATVNVAAGQSAFKVFALGADE